MQKEADEMMILGLIMLKENKILKTNVILNKLPETRQKDQAKRGFIPQAMETLGLQVIPAHIIEKKYVAIMLPVK